MLLTSNLGGASSAAFVAVSLFSAGLVAVTIKVCRKYGWVANPRADRWHKGTPSLFGGVPIWLSYCCLSLVVFPWSNTIVWKLIGASSLMFLLGLADDVWHLRPQTKLVGQILAAGIVVSSGVVYPLVQNGALNIGISLLWIVGITNAFNLLDNMDGLAAGVAIISAVYLAIFYGSNGSRDYAMLAVLVAGSVAGFLFFNFNPARIFMGDSGSLFLGFLLGATSLFQITHVSGVPSLVLAPVMILAIPVFDTLFVSITRRLRGQAVSQGGTDHSSHRLVQSGLDERGAVLLLYALSIASGGVALVARHVLYSRAIGLIGFWFLFLLLFGIHLFRSETNLPAHDPHHQSKTLLGRVFARDALAFLLDPVALSLSYYLAYFLRFRVFVPRADMDLFLYSWPIVLAVKFFCLWGSRVYQRSWWRSSLSDSYRLARATLIGEAAVILVLIGLYRFAGFSRLVFVLDAGFSWILLMVIRKSFSLFRDSLGMWGRSNGNGTDRRVFVLGTSERTELALRYLREQRIECAGLIDTNGGADLGRWVWGKPVVGGLDDLFKPGRNPSDVFEIVLPENESLPYSDVEFRARCKNARLRIMKLGLYSGEVDSVT